jgi:hypothetical protein
VQEGLTGRCGEGLCREPPISQFLLASVALPAFLVPLLSLPVPAQSSASPAGAGPGLSNVQPRCVVSSSRQISIACDYKPLPLRKDLPAGEPQIALNHAELQFDTRDDNWMSLSLTLTRLDSPPAASARTVYIEVDDDAGRNFVRRPLSAINIAGLAPDNPVRFDQRLIFPAFPPGHYQVKLWIPSNNPALKFKPDHNLLVSSAGVADAASGLNRIADFTVAKR